MLMEARLKNIISFFFLCFLFVALPPAEAENTVGDSINKIKQDKERILYGAFSLSDDAESDENGRILLPMIWSIVGVNANLEAEFFYKGRVSRVRLVRGAKIGDYYVRKYSAKRITLSTDKQGDNNLFVLSAPDKGDMGKHFTVLQ